MQTPEDLNKADHNEEIEQPVDSKKKQQQSDPQITEFKGFFDKKEKLEPNEIDIEKNKSEIPDSES